MPVPLLVSSNCGFYWISFWTEGLRTPALEWEGTQTPCPKTLKETIPAWVHTSMFQKRCLPTGV